MSHMSHMSHMGHPRRDRRRFPLPLPLRNLQRNKARHAATFLAMALGVAGLNCLAGYVVRWENTLRTMSIYLEQTGSVAVFRRGGHKAHLVRPLRYALTEEQRARILVEARESTEVVAASPVIRGQGLASDGAKTFPFVATGLEPGLQRTFLAREDVRRWAGEFAALASGRQLWERGEENPLENRLENPVGLARGLAGLLGDTSDGIQLLAQGFEGNFSAIDAHVVQTYGTGVALTEDSRLRTTLAAAERLFDTRGASWVAVYLSDHRKASAFAASLEAKLEARGVEVDAIPWHDARVSPFYVGVMGFLHMMAASFFLLIAGVVALAVVNGVLLTSLERTKETGTLRAVGFAPARIAAGFALEIFVLGVGAALAGVASAFLVSTGINAANLRFRPPGFADTVQFLLTPNALTSAAVSVLVVGVATSAAFLTAWRLARAPVATLLGEERN
jgi:putative ABC transport system permease protein